jgi:outer membrane protein OmpA-like peptidoglycan-associated protein
MEMEQIFGQPSNYQEPLLEVSDIILGLLILGLIVVFLLVSIGYLLDLKSNNPEMPDTVVIPAATPAPNKTTGQITTAAQTNTIKTTRIQTATQNPVTTTVQNPSTIKTTTNQAATQNLSTIKKITVTTPTLQSVVYQALLKEFQYDLPRWKAEIDRTFLTVRFQEPDILFKVGVSSLNQHYQSILADFFPRYVNLLKKYESAIEAFSIEGHTSSEWQSSVSQDDAYINNMVLSQERTRAVLEYCLRLPSVRPYKDWLQSILTANGFANSRLIMENGFEKVEYSRRVEFRIHIHPKFGLM